MEAKASKQVSKCEHACALARVCVCERVRVRARAAQWRRCPAGAPPRTGANSAAMRAASPKSKTAATPPASAASCSLGGA